MAESGLSAHSPPGPVSIMAYKMEAFFQDCVRTYVELTKHSHPLRKVMTPFLPEDQRLALVSKLVSDAPEASWSTCPWCKHQGGGALKTYTICRRSIRSRGGIVK